MKGMTLLLLVLARFVLGQNSISLLQIPVRSEEIEVSVQHPLEKIPVEIRNGMMFVKASLNNQTGFYMLDTGAPMLVLNREHTGANTVAASTVTGAFSVGSTSIRKFQWAGVEHKPMEAIIVDLSHFEGSTNLEIDGLIGYEVLKSFELFIDCEQRQLALLQAEKSKLLQATSPLVIVPFKLQNHLPVVEVKIGGQTLHFGVDTGAGVNLIDQKYQHLLSEGVFSLGNQEELRGVDQKIRLVSSAFVYDTQVGDAHFAKMKYLFTDLSHLETSMGLKIDGLLGFPFFQKIKCSINYPGQHLYIWEISAQ